MLFAEELLRFAFQGFGNGLSLVRFRWPSSIQDSRKNVFIQSQLRGEVGLGAISLNDFCLQGQILLPHCFYLQLAVNSELLISGQKIYAHVYFSSFLIASSILSLITCKFITVVIKFLNIVEKSLLIISSLLFKSASKESFTAILRK
jgi:hypothetical protein